MLSEWETGTKWRCKSGQRIPPPCLSYKILFLSGCSSHLTQLHPSVYHPPTDWVKEFNQSSARRISLLLFRLPARWSTYFTTAEAAYNISQYFWFGSTSFHNNSSPGLHYFFLKFLLSGTSCSQFVPWGAVGCLERAPSGRPKTSTKIDLLVLGKRG